MISPQELRIGNLVWDDYSGEMQVTEINELGDIGLRKPSMKAIGLYDAKGLKGIPLSAELLERMGAIFPHHDFRCQIGQLCYHWNPNGGLFLNDSGWNESISDIPIKYLHTLQNFHYFLTNTELTIAK